MITTELCETYVVFYQDNNKWHTDLLNMYEDDITKATEIFEKRVSEGYPKVELVKEAYDLITGLVKSTTVRVYEDPCYGCDNHCDYGMCYQA